MPRTGIRSKSGTKSKSKGKATSVNSEQAIEKNWIAEAEARRSMLLRAISKKKKERLEEIDTFFASLSPELLGMKMGEFMKMHIDDQKQDDTYNKENSPVLSITVKKEQTAANVTMHSIDSTIDKALQDLHMGRGTKRGAAKDVAHKAKAQRKGKRGTAALLETPCNSKLPDAWRNTPAITPQLQSRICHTTPLTSIRTASATDYNGMSLKLVAFNSRGSPIAPSELDCPDVLSKLSKLVKDAEKVMEEKRQRQQHPPIHEE